MVDLAYVHAQVDALNAEGKFDEADIVLTAASAMLKVELDELNEARRVLNAALLERHTRTDVKFASAFDKIKWMVNFHDKPFWLVPAKADYFLSIIAPKPDELPKDTKAWLIGPNPDDPSEPFWLESVSAA